MIIEMKNKQTIYEQIHCDQQREVIYSDLNTLRISHVVYHGGFFIKIPNSIFLYYNIEREKYMIKGTSYSKNCPPNFGFIMMFYPHEVMKKFAWNCAYYARVNLEELKIDKMIIEDSDTYYAMFFCERSEIAAKESNYHIASIDGLYCAENIGYAKRNFYRKREEEVRQSKFLMKLLTRWEKKHEKII